ncbi:MAG: hypothetical protein HRU26_01415 [Psychroserpens sp.]|nr:hypothetical protein [Psychroserpens sp.]
MSITNYSSFVKNHILFEDISIRIQRSKIEDVSHEFVVDIDQGNVIGKAKDFILKDFFSQQEAIDVVDSINTCLGITDTSDLYTGLENWLSV